MKTVENCSSGAAEKTELRASRSKTERRKASETMHWCRRGIPSSAHVTENRTNERVKIKNLTTCEGINHPLRRRYRYLQQNRKLERSDEVGSKSARGNMLTEMRNSDHEVLQ